VENVAETRVVVGARAEALAQVAAEEGADLIVLGSRSAGLARRHIRCVLAGELEAATSVPILVAPPSTRNRSGHRLAVALDAAPR
jgi:nucleotide-binding universal stress UspA family protein